MTMMSSSSSHKTGKLDPEAIRERAKNIPGCHYVPSDCPTVCSFIVGCSNNIAKEGPTGTSKVTGAAPDNIENLARVNIFVDTGTIGTCRVLQGAVRQTFRQDVSSLDVVERMLRQPTNLTLVDDSLVSLNLSEASALAITSTGTSTTKYASVNNQRKVGSQQSPSERLVSHKAKVELADVGASILQNEKEKLDIHLKGIIERPNITSSPSDRSETTAEATHHTMTAGMEFQFSLPPSSMKHVDQCLSDINDMGKYIRGVATNGRGTVFLYGHGGVAYTPHIPRSLYYKLSQMRSSPAKVRPCYVSLGTRDRYFVSFHDGTHAFKGPKGLERELKKMKNPPLSVAFGNTWDTFFIVLSDGSWRFQGRGIPAGLERKLSEREDCPDLVCVTLGPDGDAWFMKAENGQMWWGGISDELDENIQELLTTGNFLNFLDFGEDGSYFVSYDE
jgi:hypothetical protein